MTQILLVLCGIPSSGKTTFAKAIRKELPSYDFKIISTDSWRDEEYYSTFRPEKENEVRQIAFSKTKELLKAGDNVIHDDTNYYVSMRHELLELAKKYHCKFGVIEVTTSLETAIIWNEQREFVLPDFVIEKIAHRFDKPGEKYAWDSPILCINPNLDSIERKIIQLSDKMQYIQIPRDYDKQVTQSESEKRDKATRTVMRHFFEKHPEQRGVHKFLRLRHLILEKANSQNWTEEKTKKLLKQSLENEMAAS